MIHATEKAGSRQPGVEVVQLASRWCSLSDGGPGVVRCPEHVVVGGFWVFGSGPIPWVVTTIDWMLVIAPAALVTALGIGVAERMSWGRRGRHCEIDPMRGLLMIQPAGFGDDQTLEIDRISAIALRSRREDLTRGFCRTFTPTICYSATDGSSREIGLDRHRCRRSAVNQLVLLRKVLHAGKSGDQTILDEHQLPAAPVTFPAATWPVADPAASFSD